MRSPLDINDRSTEAVLGASLLSFLSDVRDVGRAVYDVCLRSAMGQMELTARRGNDPRGRGSPPDHVGTGGKLLQTGGTYDAGAELVANALTMIDDGNLMSPTSEAERGVVAGGAGANDYYVIQGRFSCGTLPMHNDEIIHEAIPKCVRQMGFHPSYPVIREIIARGCSSHPPAH